MFFLDTFMKGLKPHFDDDIVDRLNNFYTPMILIVFSLTLSAKNYVGQPIQCWVPAQFTGAWEQYTENYCFVQNTYFLPMSHYIPRDYATRTEKEIGYYQWVPFIIALQAILFYIPCLLWRLLNWQSGITVKGIVNSAIDTKNMEEKSREEKVGVVAAYIHDSIEVQGQLSTRGRFLGVLFYGKHYGSYVTGLYLVIKFLYIVNVVGQFFILNSFLGPNYTFWGFEILRDLYNGREWQESGHFPRVTMCDFDVRVLGNLHRWTVQCVLMINMFNEKIYLFLWFWFFIVAIASILSAIYWCLVTAIHSQQRTFVERYLRISDKFRSSHAPRQEVEDFVHKSLRPDGVFLLRMIANNAGDLLTNEVVEALWSRFDEEWHKSLPPPPSLTGRKESPMDDDGFIDSNPYSEGSDQALIPSGKPSPAHV